MHFLVWAGRDCAKNCPTHNPDCFSRPMNLRVAAFLLEIFPPEGLRERVVSGLEDFNSLRASYLGGSVAIF